MNDRLFRSRTDRVISGVCGGVADRFDLDPSLVRVGYAILWLFTGIVPFTIVYVLMTVIVPEEPGDAWGGFGPAGPPAGGSTFTAPAAAGAPTVPVGTAPDGAHGPAGAASPPPAADAGGAGWAAGGAGAPSWAAGAPPSGEDRWARQRTDRDARRAARRAARAERRSDPLAAIIIGLVLISIGAWFLLRNVVRIEWDLVWPAAILALGVVLVVIAVLPRPGRR